MNISHKVRIMRRFKSRSSLPAACVAQSLARNTKLNSASEAFQFGEDKMRHGSKRTGCFEKLRCRRIENGMRLVHVGFELLRAYPGFLRSTSRKQDPQP
jgi:hypothetical protein